jgi:hypothetical protein
MFRVATVRRRRGTERLVAASLILAPTIRVGCVFHHPFLVSILQDPSTQQEGRRSQIPFDRYDHRIGKRVGGKYNTIPCDTVEARYPSRQFELSSLYSTVHRFMHHQPLRLSHPFGTILL